MEYRCSLWTTWRSFFYLYWQNLLRSTRDLVMSLVSPSIATLYMEISLLPLTLIFFFQLSHQPFRFCHSLSTQMPCCLPWKITTCLHQHTVLWLFAEKVSPYSVLLFMFVVSFFVFFIWLFDLSLLLLLLIYLFIYYYFLFFLLLLLLW